MSDEIPFHIQEEIMKRLPVKSLIRFRSVSKGWKSLIDSSDFIGAHSLRRHTQPQHLLVSYNTREEGKKYVSFVDDETLFQQRPGPESPPYAKENRFTELVGVSHGLVCFYCPDDNLAVIWNPSIRKALVVDVPDEPFVGQRFVGFSVCPLTTDPKIVVMKQSWDDTNMETCYQCEVMVYTLSAGEWRSLSTNLPTQLLRRWHGVVAVDGFIYWFCDTLSYNKIISFDVTNESFEMIYLPTALASHYPWVLPISKIRESLAMLQYRNNACTVWKMESVVQRSFTELFTIPASLYSLVGFRKSGLPILRVENDGNYKLVVYEPNSEHNNVLEVFGDPLHLTVNSYMETLLLLG